MLVNDPVFTERAEIIREKGTNRSQFFRGQTDKHTWVDIGSSYLPGEIIAAFLYAQMEEAQTITDRRLALWSQYHARLAAAESSGKLRRPLIPTECRCNAHMCYYYYVLLPDLAQRSEFIARMKLADIQCVCTTYRYTARPPGVASGAPMAIYT